MYDFTFSFGKRTLAKLKNNIILNCKYMDKKRHNSIKVSFKTISLLFRSFNNVKSNYKQKYR